MTIATSDKSASPKPPKPPRRPAGFLSAIGPPHPFEKDGDDHHDDDEEAVGHGAGIADVEETEAGAKREHRIGLRRYARPATGERKRNVEELQGLCQAEEDDDAEGRLEGGQDDEAERRPWAGAIDDGGLVLLVGNA